MSVRRLIEEVADRFGQARLAFGHGTSNAWDEAAWLVLTVAELPDEAAVLERPLAPATVARVRALAEARIDSREPLAYLLGEAMFFGLRLEAERGVIVPRSPIGELLIGRLNPWRATPPLRILDLCCGGGALALLAAHVFEAAEVLASDIDPAAVALARRNARRLGLDARVRIMEADLFDDAATRAASPFDVILCNPPYVASAALAALPAEYLAEPAHALAAGADGLAVLRRVLDEAGGYIRADGLLVGEAGESASALEREFGHLPFIWPALESDAPGVFLLEGSALASHTHARA